MTEQLFDVFLAHNSVDKPQVRAIATKLREQGIKPWLDEEQIPPGMSFQDEIQKAIPLIKAAAIIIGTQGLGKWQIMELRSLITKFVDRKIPVIPVLLPGVDKIPGDLLFLQELNWVKFEQIDDLTAFCRLEWGITQVKPDLHPKTVQLTAEEWFNIGYNKGESGDYQGAIAKVRSKLNNKTSELIAPEWLDLGNNKYDLGDFQGAIADYNQAIQIDPCYGNAYYNLKCAKRNLEDNQGAIAGRDQGIKRRKAGDYYVCGANKYDRGDYEGAITDYTQAIQLKPDYATVYNNRGITKYYLGDKQGAITDCKQAAQLFLQQGNMQGHSYAINNIKNLEKGFWRSLLTDTYLTLDIH